jgi:hypothetical protein
MPVRIGEGIMHLEIDGRVVATATERVGGWWEVTHRPRFFDRNQAITWAVQHPDQPAVADLLLLDGCWSGGRGDR